MLFRNAIQIIIKSIVRFSIKDISNKNKNLISTLMKSTNNIKKKEKISIEYERPEYDLGKMTKKSSESVKKQSLYDSKMSLAETLLKDKSKNYLFKNF